MNASGSNCLLNTENYGPLIKLIKRINQGIQENEGILGKLTTQVDENIRLQDLSNIGFLGDVQTPGLKTKSDQKFDLTETNDYLRDILDQKFTQNKVADTDQFEDVENPVLRRLMIDNYKLLQMKNAKERRCRHLLELSREYEQLLSEVIIPALVRDVSAKNISDLQSLKDLVLETKLKSQKEIWREYENYLDLVDKCTKLVHRIYKGLSSSLESAEVNRVALQLSILELLRSQVNAQSLRHFQ